MSHDEFMELCNSFATRRIEWMNKNIPLAEGARAVRLTDPAGDSCLQFIIHPSCYNPGQWQVTTFDMQEVPFGHQCADTMIHALEKVYSDSYHHEVSEVLY
jgi:hypothetical protein